MFGWLRSLFGKGRSWDDAYAPKDRLIYRYFNGKEIIAADPLVLYKRMMDKGPDLSIDSKVATSTLLDDKAVSAAHNSLVSNIREIFSIEELSNKGGLTEIETVELWDHFLLYCSSIKKKPSQPSTSPPATSPTSPSSPVDVPPTATTSDTGSAATESSTAPPEPLPSASASV